MTNNVTLVIGNKNYSSWSLRPWLLLRQRNIDFQELRLPLDTPEFQQSIYRYSPSGRVPVLIHNDLSVWDSLAIAEYVNERFLQGSGWPEEASARAIARAISAEMHSGFADLRAALPMNCRKRLETFLLSREVQRDIDRICQIWRTTRERYGCDGAFLFGKFSIADAMYAPVVLRFRSYGISIGPIEQNYCETIIKLPAMQRWVKEAEKEQETLNKYENNL